jgi:hypothetical protein
MVFPERVKGSESCGGRERRLVRAETYGANGKLHRKSQLLLAQNNGKKKDLRCGGVDEPWINGYFI